jgi:hypothetical protein
LNAPVAVLAADDGGSFVVALCAGGKVSRIEIPAPERKDPDPTPGCHAALCPAPRPKAAR